LGRRKRPYKSSYQEKLPLNFAVCAIFKNEAPYLREWIKFHQLLGAEKFYLFDNESTDDWEVEVQDLVYDGLVEVEHVAGDAMQLPVYENFLNYARDLAEPIKWVAFIDIDEYLYAPDGRTIPEVLESHNDCAVVEADWLMFGSSGYKKRPQGLTIDAYTLRENAFDKHHKSIVRASLISKFADPHTVITNLRKSNATNELVINHYWSRSEEECLAKFLRGRVDLQKDHPAWEREWSEYTVVAEKFSAVQDDTIKNLWSAKLKDSL